MEVPRWVKDMHGDHTHWQYLPSVYRGFGPPEG